jgi:two-component system sensor histidine kinase KdpD
VSAALPDDLPLIEIDAVLIERVLCNLLENAAKYTPAGTHISISAAVRGSEVDVWVDDSGPGFPKGREEAIFQKFERGARESATPGVGLGLAICRAIVEAHGGSIHAENRATAVHVSSFRCRAACRRRPPKKSWFRQTAARPDRPTR